MFSGHFQFEEQLVKNRHPELFFELVYALPRRESWSFALAEDAARNSRS
jgi:hypothetical protein